MRAGCAATLLLALASCLDPIADPTLSFKVAIESVTPSTVVSRGGGEVIVTGRNFAPDSQVLVDGAPVSFARVIDETRLTFVAPPRRAGKAALTIATRDGDTTRDEALRYYAEEVVFTPGSLLIELDMEGKTIAGSGDLDGDGREELLVFDGATFALSPLHSEVGFAPSWPGAVLLSHSAPFVEDLDGDGRVDLIDSKNFHLNGDGVVFETLRVPFATSSPDEHRPVAPKFDDVDGDGHPEALELWQSGASPCPQLYVWTFVPSPSAKLFPICAAGSAAFGVGDFDGDHRADLAYVDLDGHVQVALGPTFDLAKISPSRVVKPGDVALELTVAEVTSDRLTDVTVTIDDPSRPLIVVAQQSNGDLFEPAQLNGGCGDLSARLLVPSFTHRKLEWTPMLTCRSAPAWVVLRSTQPRLVPAPIPLEAIPVVVDLDGDDRADIAWSGRLGPEGAFGIMPPGDAITALVSDPLLGLEHDNAPSGRFVFAGRGNFGPGRNAVAVLPDEVVLLDLTARSRRVAAELLLPDPQETALIAAAMPCDVDADGDDDLLVLLSDSLNRITHGALLKFEGASLSLVDGPSLRDLNLSTATLSVVAGAVSVKGRCELVVSHRGRVAWLDPANGWQHHTFDFSADLVGATAADLDRDGLLDFAGVTPGPGWKLRVIHSESNEASDFDPPPDLPLGNSVGAVAAAAREAGGYDFWLLSIESRLVHFVVDSRWKLVAADSAQVTNAVFPSSNALSSITLVVGDYDGDGVKDVYPFLVSSLQPPPRAPPLMLSGPAASMRPVSMPKRPSALFALDFDRDGLDDFVYLPHHAGLAFFHNESR